MFINRRSGSPYRAHNPKEKDFVELGCSRHTVITGGVASGKTTAGIIRSLTMITEGAVGLVLAGSWPRARKDLWPQFASWLTPEMLISRQRYRLDNNWQPFTGFQLDFASGGRAYFSTLRSDDWSALRGNFVFWDEADLNNIDVLKNIDAVARYPTRQGYAPQIWLAPTALPPVPEDWTFPNGRHPASRVALMYP